MYMYVCTSARVYVCVHVCASAGVRAQVCVRSSVFQCGAIQCAYSQVVVVNALSSRVTEGVPINNTLSLPGLSRIRKLRMPHVFSCASVASESVCVHVLMHVTWNTRRAFMHASWNGCIRAWVFEHTPCIQAFVHVSWRHSCV